ACAEESELWWLESGELQIDASGEHLTLREKECFVRSPGDAIDNIRATGDCVLIRFCGATAHRRP
ncbi:MAG TPA: hypothetical protein VK968_18480, partial [Roseimicrobium sp.]|nr:hypothetical protein [Roseimicrobium sp.]